MTRLPRITGKQVISILQKNGFQVIRIKGSHHFLAHSNGRHTVVPVHRGEIIGPGLLSQILRDVEMSREEFISFM
ncbi:MAG: type II toxin-antitoxin system HicA family toxin [Anaerolinea sp.]|nr:type II toxin-antitoxin system HicA family toxin [Anaerolinea sp.]